MSLILLFIRHLRIITELNIFKKLLKLVILFAKFAPMKINNQIRNVLQQSILSLTCIFHENKPFYFSFLDLFTFSKVYNEKLLIVLLILEFENKCYKLTDLFFLTLIIFKNENKLF